MRICFVLFFTLTLATMAPAKEKMIRVVDRDGRAWVSATSLAKDAGIAIKHLPGQNQVVACNKTRCALVKESLREGHDTLVPVTALAEALGSTAKFDAKQQRVSFHFGNQGALPPAEAAARVGQVAPNFRMTRLDGGPVALADFRGKRVLINSWASW